MIQKAVNQQTGIQDPRLISVDRAAQVYEKLKNFSNGDGEIVTRFTATWNSSLRWSRNHVNMGSDRRSLWFSVVRTTADKKGMGGVVTNQLDDDSLQGAVKAAERRMGWTLRREDLPYADHVMGVVDSKIWSDHTFNSTVEARGRVAQLISEKSAEHGMFAAGFIEVHAGHIVEIDAKENISSIFMTQSQCSITVRNPKGAGSGWAGVSSYDWEAINPDAIAKVAFDKCIASSSPVRIEPGRYTVIMEPQAVYGCIRDLLHSFSRRRPEDNKAGPFYLGTDQALGINKSKLGLQVIDNRITISHDPYDPLLGTLNASPEKRVWIENGILVSLDLDRDRVISRQTVEGYDDERRGFHVSGGDTSIEEMIASTKRGLLMTRFHNWNTIDFTSLLATGVTRDGLWLIENGAITKAVNNMRSTDSPLFMLNQVEQLGVPVPIFNPVHSSFSYLTPCIVPPIKSRDFSFTSLVDAV